MHKKRKLLFLKKYIYPHFYTIEILWKDVIILLLYMLQLHSVIENVSFINLFAHALHNHAEYNYLGESINILQSHDPNIKMMRVG